MRVISRARFDAYCGYCRNPMSQLFSREVSWFESDLGGLFATLVLDTDFEYSVLVFAPDLQKRFRFIIQTNFFPNPAGAVNEAESLIGRIEVNLDAEGIQGDESTSPVDFFTPIVETERLHQFFRLLATGDEFSAARKLIEIMMRWYEDCDGNFVEQFQTTGFNARIWELYLYATLIEAGCVVTRPDPAPDYLAISLRGAIAVEATTINPTVDDGQIVPTPKPQTKEEIDDYVRNYLPLRFAGPLKRKLRKRYWEYPEIAEIPLTIAIQDFHDDLSMTYSGSALQSFLYGLESVGSEAGEDSVGENLREVASHQWQGRETESGFFNFPESENVSAVLFNSSGTLSKFNRMGVRIGFGSPNVILKHSGLRIRCDYDVSIEQPFSDIVTVDYPEHWIDGMDVFHNPNAIHPLDPSILPGAAHHHLLSEGNIGLLIPSTKLITSITHVVKIRPDPK
jgi:hypothetical protein